MYYNITAQTPNTRKQIISLYKKAFTRIKEGLAVLNRTIKTQKSKQRLLHISEEKECESKKQNSDSLPKSEENINYLNLEIDEEFKFELTADISEAIRNKALYEHFLTHMLRECLIPGLVTDANYPRRSAALELLLFFHQTFPEKQWKDLWFDEDINNLKYNIIFDSYESNKEMIVTLLKQFSSKKIQFVSEKPVSKEI